MRNVGRRSPVAVDLAPVLIDPLPLSEPGQWEGTGEQQGKQVIHFHARSLARAAKGVVDDLYLLHCGFVSTCIFMLAEGDFDATGTIVHLEL